MCVCACVRSANSFIEFALSDGVSEPEYVVPTNLLRSHSRLVLLYYLPDYVVVVLLFQASLAKSFNLNGLICCLRSKKCHAFELDAVLKKLRIKIKAISLVLLHFFN